MTEHIDNGRRTFILPGCGFETLPSIVRNGVLYNHLSTVMAASAIANIVKSSLGPVGLDKMLVDDIGVCVTLFIVFMNMCLDA